MPTASTIAPEVEILQKHVTELTASIKAKRSELASILDEVARAKEQAALAIREAERQSAARQEVIARELAPAEQQLRQVKDSLKETTVMRDRTLQQQRDELSALKQERTTALASLDKQIREKDARLAVITKAIADCQAKVQAL